MATIDHVTFAVSDYTLSVAFYDRALAPLGLKRLADVTAEQSGTSAFCGYGEERPFFWIGEGGALTGRLHVAFTAATRGEVYAFYAAALAAGGRDNGAPGLRPHYGPDYYGGFVRDLDGHNIEAVCRIAQ